MRVPLATAVVSVSLLVLTSSSARSGKVSGPYANRVSSSDLAQIKAAVSKERHISHNVKKIDAVRPDKVTIQTTARTAVDEDTYYEFNAHKRSGVGESTRIQSKSLSKNGTFGPMARLLSGDSLSNSSMNDGHFFVNLSARL